MVEAPLRRRIADKLVHDVMYRSRLGPTVESESQCPRGRFAHACKLLERLNRECLRPEQMAERFRVSLTAMKNRLRIK
jgi:hypothetical protein